MFGWLIRHLAKATSASIAGSCQYPGLGGQMLPYPVFFVFLQVAKIVFLTTGLSFHPGYYNPDMMFTCINNKTGHLKTPSPAVINQRDV